MRKWILALALALILLLAIPLALLLRDFVRDVFLVELGRAVWAARLLFESLPQVVIWAVLVAVLLALALRALRPRSRPQLKEGQGPAKSAGRVGALARWIDRSARSEYFRQSLAHHLTGLAWEVMAYREHTSPARVQQRLRAGGLDLPPVVGETLEVGQTPYVLPSEGIFARLGRRLAPGKSAGTGSDPDAGWDPALQPLIEFLESQLEIRTED
jgi:hypothetical protein